MFLKYFDDIYKIREAKTETAGIFRVLSFYYFHIFDGPFDMENNERYTRKVRSVLIFFASDNRITGYNHGHRQETFFPHRLIHSFMS